MYGRVNSLRPGNAMSFHRSLPDGTKPLSEPMLIYHQLGSDIPQILQNSHPLIVCISSRQYPSGQGRASPVAWKPRVAIMPPLPSLMAPYALPITKKLASWQFSLCESTSSPPRKQHNYDVVITTKWYFDIIVTSRYGNVLCKINQVIPYIYIYQL